MNIPVECITHLDIEVEFKGACQLQTLSSNITNRVCVKLDENRFLDLTLRDSSKLFGRLSIVRPILIFDHRQLFLYRFTNTDKKDFVQCDVFSRPGFEEFLHSTFEKFHIKVVIPEEIYQRIVPGISYMITPIDSNANVIIDDEIAEKFTLDVTNFERLTKFGNCSRCLSGDRGCLVSFEKNFLLYIYNKFFQTNFEVPIMKMAKEFDHFIKYYFDI